MLNKSTSIYQERKRGNSYIPKRTEISHGEDLFNHSIIVRALLELVDDECVRGLSASGRAHNGHQTIRRALNKLASVVQGIKRITEHTIEGNIEQLYLFETTTLAPEREMISWRVMPCAPSRAPIAASGTASSMVVCALNVSAHTPVLTRGSKIAGSVK